MVAQLASQLAEVRSGARPIQANPDVQYGKVEGDEAAGGLSRLENGAGGPAGDGLIDTEAEAASTLEL